MSQMKAKSKSLLHEPVRIGVPEPQPQPAAPDRINVYVCPTCHGFTVTIDIHEGVTPFLLGCRATGQPGDCRGMARSSFYPKERPVHIPAPAWEWFMPTGREYHKLAQVMKDHVDKGGLVLRKRRQLAEVTR
ncbi:MAG: hypothetical protein KGL39_39600 [Patescibacteria group bacterium]|nr:hypothetical protein [Patescibacteria group bacterium]